MINLKDKTMTVLFQVERRVERGIED